MNYSLTVQIYHQSDKKLIVADYQSGLKFAKLLSELLSMAGNWTRHSSCQGAIHHMDYYSDLYNEGAIILEQIKE